jgi:hypothetical protein
MLALLLSFALAQELAAYGNVFLRVRGLEPLSVFAGRIGLMLRSSP